VSSKRCKNSGHRILSVFQFIVGANVRNFSANWYYNIWLVLV